jgi:hypothetical protein
VQEFARTARAVRQIIVLEFEILGIWAPPDRSAWHEPVERPEAKGQFPGYGKLRDDLDDYNRGPLDEVIAGIRDALDTERPKNDPFAAPPRRRAGRPMWTKAAKSKSPGLARKTGKPASR